MRCGSEAYHRNCEMSASHAVCASHDLDFVAVSHAVAQSLLH